MRRLVSRAVGISTLVLSAAALLLTAPGAAALTIDVNTVSDDYGATPTTCSLREAIDSAATDSGFDGCSTGGGADTIRVPAGTYAVTRPGVEDFNMSGDFDVKGIQPLTIEPADAAARVVIDGNGIDRVFHVQDSVPLTLRNVTVTGGQLTMIDDGGGILNGSSELLSLEGTTVRDSSATVAGGGIASYSGLSIVNSTISGNESAQSAGGIYLPGAATATIRSSTIADNTADSNADGNGDGGGFAGGMVSSVSFYNVINALNRDLSPNPGDQSPDCSSGPFFFPRFTLSSQPMGAGTCLVGFGHPGNQVAADPGISPLADNGGQTPTHALLDTSLAIAAGGTVAPDQCPPTDQTGRSRPAGSCDIGAVQFVAPSKEAKLIIKRVLPNNKKVSRGGKTKIRVLVRNKGDAPALKVRVCVKLKSKKTRKALKVKGKSCRTVGKLKAGSSKKPKFKLKARPKAKRASYRAVAKARAKDLPARSGGFKVRVR